MDRWLRAWRNPETRTQKWVGIVVVVVVFLAFGVGYSKVWDRAFGAPTSVTTWNQR